MKYLLNDKLYTILKWVGLIACPAIAVFVGTVGSAWGWQHIEPTVITINAVGVLIGALIGISQASAKPEQGNPGFDVPVMTDDEIAAVFDDADDK